MKEFIKEYTGAVIGVLFAWALLSFLRSSIKTIELSCGKTYPIDYIFYSSLFCEIET